jgi:hypoxanthine phosphoribosyltransferase
MRLHPDIERVLFTEEEIRAKVAATAAQVSLDYAGREPILVGVLKGSVFFLADLARALQIPARIDFLSVAPFRPNVQQSNPPANVSANVSVNVSVNPGVVRILKDLDHSIEDQDVLLVEDIVDTGLTLRYLLRTLGARRPRSLHVCALLDRAIRRLADVPIRYRCFEIPDRFLVGYGLDYQQLYRNLPYVGVVKSGIFRG